MKSRIKKLLAAALALCLIAAMVPGAALAADTGNFSTVTKGSDEKTYYNSFSDALDAAKGFTDPANKYVTVEADNAEISGIIPSGVTLRANGKDLTVTGNLTVYGTIENAGDIDANSAVTIVNGGSLKLGGTMNVATNVVVDVQGALVNNGSIVLATGSSSNRNTALNVTGSMSGSGDITVGTYASATLPANIEMSGDLTNRGTVTVSGSKNMVTTGNINNSGTLTANISANGSSEITNSGTISGTVSIDNAASMTISGNGTVSGAITVNGELTVSNNRYTQSSTITVSDVGTMNITGNNYTLSAQLTVNNKLNIEGCDFDASTHLNVGEDATVSITDSDVSVSSYDFKGTTTIEDSAFTVGNTQIVGPDTISGSFELTKDSTEKILTVNSGTVENNYAFNSSKANRLVVEGTLSLGANLTIDTGILEVNGRLTVPIHTTLTAKTGIEGNGNIDVAGYLYNDNTFDADEVDIQIQGDGLVYSQSSALLYDVVNGTPTTVTPPNGGNNYVLALSRGTGGTFNVTVDAGTHGSVSTTNFTATAGDDVRINATPDDGYMVDTANTYYENAGGGRSDSVNVNGNVCTFNMPNNDVTVYINFKEAETPDEPTGTTYTISRGTSANGTFVVNANKADAGETVTITTSPNSGYKVSRVSVTGATATKFADNVYIFTMPAQNVTVSVTFERGDYTVTLTNYTYDDGRISLSSGTTTTGRYAEGERVYIYAYPDRDFYVRSLTITRTDNRQTVNYYESSSSDDVFYFDMPASDVTVRAYFTDGVYEIATDIDGSGRLTITGEDGNVTDVAEEGEEIRITASPSNNYRLGDLYVTYTDSDDEDQVIYPEVEYKNNGNVDYYWFEMPEYDVEIYADFGEGDYVAWIDRSDMENGTIRVSPNVADEDDTVSIYVTPDTGYQLDELIVEDEDGRDVTTTSLASGTRYTFRMPDSDVTVTATFKSRSYSSNFTDVPRYEWYYEAVSYVASEGLMNGVSTTQFNPNGTASRAQIVTILWRLAGEPSALTGAFTDVPAGQYYSTAVAWASRQGIVTGVGNNRFEPNSNITREQLAVILYRYAQDAGYTTSASANITGYYDYARVNSYARTAMSWAVGAGLITGTSTTTLSPQDTATRAQVATILMRFCENIAK